MARTGGRNSRRLACSSRGFPQRPDRHREQAVTEARAGFPVIEDHAADRRGERSGTGPSHRRGRDRRTGRSRRAGYNADRFSAAAVSTSSERRRGPPGHHPETVAQPEPTGSVRRSIEAVIEGLEGSAPGPHLDVVAVRQRSSTHLGMSGGRSAASAVRRPCGRHRRRAPARLLGDPRQIDPERVPSDRRSSRFTRFYLRADRRPIVDRLIAKRARRHDASHSPGARPEGDRTIRSVPEQTLAQSQP